MMVSLPSGVITRAAMRGVQPRQRLDVEMIVVAVRDQHDIDRRQRVERDAGIVDALRPDEARTARRAPTTPGRSGCSGRRSAAASSHGRQRKCASRARRPAPAACRCGGSARVRPLRPVPRRDTSAWSERLRQAFRRHAVRHRRSACRRNGRRPGRRSSAPLAPRRPNTPATAPRAANPAKKRRRS